MGHRTCSYAIIFASIILGGWWLLESTNTVYGCAYKFEDPASCYPTVYIIDGVYCFNNGSGICKMFAGRFEFYYDTFKDKFLGPVPKSQFVDQFGYHERVPFSYNITGHIIYVDRAINWARIWAPKQGKRLNLLWSTSFNWCRLAVNNWWPYKSSIPDPTGRYHIFFFNRQSCIYDSQNNDTENSYQHFNTRFLHNTTLRIDLDMNPVIFAMEDKYATSNPIRLVKHFRQHWYEVEYKVLVKPTAELNYFVKMEPTQTDPCKVDGTRGFITKEAIQEFSGSRCLDDTHHSTRIGKNAPLFSRQCGLDKTEVADLPYPVMKAEKSQRYIVDELALHNLPKHPPKITENFYGVNIENDEDWMVFAKDGLVFSATTTIPIDDTTVRVIMLFADFSISTPQTYSDEHYPLPMLADYTAKLIVNEESLADSQWEFDRASKARPSKTLNYVDDIAYLHQCKNILVILGPLYSELPVDSFLSLDTVGPVESIYNLGIFEMVGSFFAVPDSNTIWVYHRTNFVADHKYTCNSGRDGLVTATKGSGKYYPRESVNQPPFFQPAFDSQSTDHFEESFFKDMNMFGGSLDSPEAPDPAKYPLGNDDIGEPLQPKDNTWLYILVGLAILLVLAMCIICMFAMRARRRRRHKKGGEFGPRPTTRSSFLDSILSPFSAMLTRRSSLKSKPPSSGMGSRLTTRTSLQSNAGRGSIPGSTATRRSRLGSRLSGKNSRSSGKLNSNRTKRSDMTQISSLGRKRDNLSSTNTRRSILNSSPRARQGGRSRSRSGSRLKTLPSNKP